MASIEEILGKNINSIKELRAEIKNLQDSLIGVDADSEQFKTTSQQLAAAQEELTKVTRAGKEENVAAKDSIVGMKNEYKALYDQYKLLSDEQRNSDFGKNMAESLETLSSKINDTQKGVGSFKDNIGNYTASVSEAFNKMGISVGSLQGPFKAAQTASGGLNTAFKTLAVNPIMLAITAIVAILVKAAAAIKNNEELTQRLHQAMSVFKPVLDAVSNAFDFLADIIVKVVEGFAKFSAKVLSIIPGMNKAIKSHQELAKATDELTKKQRENEIVNSQKQADIERLREEASATDDVIEKKKLLEEAKAKQAEVDQANIEIAQEELRIMQEYGEKTANSAEENENLAAAQKKVNDAIAQGERNQKMYNKQLDAATSKSKAAASSTKNYREEAKKLYEQTIENSKTEIQKLTEKYEKEKKLLEKYNYDTTLLTKHYNADVYKINKEAEDKSREERLKALQRRNADIQAEIELNRLRGKELLAIEQEIEGLRHPEGAIAAVQKIDAQIEDIIRNLTDVSKIDWSNFDESYEVAAKAAREWENLVNDKGFEALGDEYKDLKDAVAEANADFGLNITSVRNLQTNYETLLQTLKQLKGEHAIQDIADQLNAFNQISLDEEMSMMFGGFSPAEIATEQARNTAEALELEKQLLQNSLATFEGTTKQKIELTQRLYQVQTELLNRQAELEALNQQRTSEMIENLIDAADRMTSALGTWKQTRESVIDSELKAGKISEQEATKQKKRLLTLERIERDFAIATIVADAASGAFSIWKGYATEVGVINAQTAAAAGPGAAVAKAALDAKSLVSAIAKTAGLAATATAQIAAAQGKYVVAKNNMSAESGGGSIGVAAAPMLIDSTPYSYTRTVQTKEEEDVINQRPIVCSIVDIEDAMDARKVRVTETSF